MNNSDRKLYRKIVRKFVKLAQRRNFVVAMLCDKGADLSGSDQSNTLEEAVDEVHDELDGLAERARSGLKSLYSKRAGYEEDAW